MGAGLALQAVGLGWLAAVSTPTLPYSSRRRSRSSLSGAGMALFFAPVANVVLSSVRADRGRARPRARTTRSASSAACSASRCSPSIFTHEGGYRTAHAFVHGMTPAVYVGAAIVAVGSLAAFGIKGRCRSEALAPVTVD